MWCGQVHPQCGIRNGGVGQGTPCRLTSPSPHLPLSFPRSVRNERGLHLHGEAPGMAFQLGVLLWLCLHPGLGGLPPGPSQRRHIRDLAETRMRRPDSWSEALSIPRGREEGNQKPEKKKKRVSQKTQTQTIPNRKQLKGGGGLVLTEDVYNIYGL